MHIINLLDADWSINQVVRDYPSLDGRIENCTRAVYARAVTKGIGGLKYDTASLDEVPVPTAHA